jgi:hypothetical protein
VILDMVHHNPGEAPLRSAFLQPAHLVDYGYTGQVFKHINCIATFAALGAGLAPARAWLEPFTAGIERELRAAKAAGLAVFYHIDLFVLPKVLVERYQDKLCDRHGRISVDSDFTLEIHRIMFDELFARYPELDGFIIRHGETYLFDTPHHVGNGPVAWHPPLAEPAKEHDRFVRLINFLREEICVRHGRTLIFRTWDYLDHKFHADPAYYRAVTDRVAPHEKLFFSIKHTRLDFFRRVMVNEAIGQGRHRQIIEVQCAREYEGKGAYPNYIARGVIEGFPENARRSGLRDWSVAGVYTWSRGGGWYGPYIANELWCDLNAFVVAGFAAGRGSEEELFARYACERLQLFAADAGRFRELCLLSTEAVLQGRYCEAYDRTLGEKHVPVNLWMRDDRLGGRDQLQPVFASLRDQNAVAEALAEKAEAVALWQRIVALADGIQFPDERTGHFVRLSCRYGERLFRIVNEGWRALLLGQPGHYQTAWENYRALADEPDCPSLYRGDYFAMPGQPPAPGLDASLAELQRKS